MSAAEETQDTRPDEAIATAAATHETAQSHNNIRNDIPTARLHELVMTSLDDDQAQDVVSIPLAGKSSIADYMIVGSGRSSRQVAAIAQKLAERIKKAGGTARLEGLPAADWVLIDAGDIVVHLFRPEVRSFYNLERMWGFGDAPETASSAQ